MVFFVLTLVFLPHLAHGPLWKSLLPWRPCGCVGHWQSSSRIKDTVVCLCQSVCVKVFYLCLCCGRQNSISAHILSGFHGLPINRQTQDSVVKILLKNQAFMYCWHLDKRLAKLTISTLLNTNKCTHWNSLRPKTLWRRSRQCGQDKSQTSQSRFSYKSGFMSDKER